MPILMVITIHILAITAPDKKGHQHSNVFISIGKSMLWVLIRSASVRHF